jgi:hypothetical protein
VGILLAIALVWLLAGCSPAADSSGAAEVVEAYYQALADENADQMRSLSCAAWEENAQLEFDAFAGVETELDSFVCEVSGTDGEFTLVECSGKIVATYGNEKQDFDLGDVTYKSLVEAGEWRMCGY